MAALIGATFRFLHRLKFHLWADIPLNTWVIAILVVLAPLPILGLIPGGLAVTVLCLLLIVVLWVSQAWARRRYYVHFQPETEDLPELDHPLWPEDKLLLRATGRFEVEGSAGDFTDLIAYYRTFETREHAIMARVTPSRFLIGGAPPEKLGMWYIFLTPNDLQTVSAGKIYYGGHPSPALRLDFMRSNDKGKRVPTIAYLRFDSEADRRRVQADLCLDLGGPAQIPWRPPEDSQD